MKTVDRFRGCLLGLACGDAVGTTLEFKERGTFEPLTDMVGGGPFNLLAGEWTDDTSMALCLAQSLIHCKDFNAADQMERYVSWWKDGHLSSTGVCFDIGSITMVALTSFIATKNPYAGNPAAWSAGNGPLMRLAPIPMFFAFDGVDVVISKARESASLTHGAAAALDCTEILATIIHRALFGLLDKSNMSVNVPASASERIRSIACAEYVNAPLTDILGTGYCVNSLEAALYCFVKTDTFEQAVLMAANLGDDADTTAAIVGQIAGAYYGVDAIPISWLKKLYGRLMIDTAATELFKLAQLAE